MSTSIYSLYETTNLINGKIYIGVHRETTWPKIDNYLGSGYVLKLAIAKYGKDNFKRKILCISNIHEYVYYLEKQLVTEEFINESNNYNAREGGLGTSIISKESRAKMSKTRTGRLLSPEWKEKISAAVTGYKHTPEAKAKMSAAKQNPSPEARANNSAAQQGKILSLDTRAKISNSMKKHWGNIPKNNRKGKKLSPETIAKRTATRKANKIKNRKIQGWVLTSINRANNP